MIAQRALLYLRDFMVIVACLLVGKTLAAILPFAFPGSIIGMLLLFVLLAWYGVDYALRTRFQISAALGVSMMYVYVGMPIGCALLAVHLLLIARRYVRGREFAQDDGVSHDAAAAL